MEIGIYTFAEFSPDAGPAGRWIRPRAPAEAAGGDRARRSGRAWTSSASVSTTARTSRCPRPRSCWPRPPSGPSGSGSRARSRVLSSDDPVRVFQDFATLDLLSGGRAEIMAGRGSFVESFPLFGYDLDDYDELFAEKLSC